MSDLDREAWSLLEHAEDLSPLAWPMRPVLRVWQYPSFEPYCSWTILVPVDAKLESEGWLVRRATWEQRHYPFPGNPWIIWVDGTRHPLPRVWDRISPRQRVSDLLDSFDLLSVPSMQGVPELGLDGVTYGVKRAGGQRLAWWWKGPPEWESLAAWHARARGDLQALFDEDDP